MRIEKGQRPPERAKMRARSLAGLGGLVLIAGILVWLWYSAYVLHAYGSAMRNVLRVVPLPAAYVIDEVVWVRDVAELAWFAQASGLDDPYDRALETAIRRAYIRSLASRVGVSVDHQVLQNMMDGIDTSTLDALGWSRGEYEHYIAEPLVLEQTLEEALYDPANDSYQKDVYDRMQSLQAQYVNVGIDFGDLAYQYSQAASAEQNGWLGYLSVEDLPEEYESVKDMDIGDTKIIELDRTYALVRVYDVTYQDGEVDQIALQEIVLDKEPLGTILDAYIGENSFIVQFLR